MFNHVTIKDIETEPIDVTSRPIIAHANHYRQRMEEGSRHLDSALAESESLEKMRFEEQRLREQAEERVRLERQFTRD